MILKSLYLKNIRSYNEQELFFKEGMTLLSGDIGSGKSSVLLGIEFALFGLIRGSITGSSLLRHGCKEGLVKLRFSINNINYEIERALKKTSTGIVQDKCAFSTNKDKEFLMPLDLKSKVLNLLGYPDDLVSKSKTLIFRYTVYTPQEEMKQILFESKDERLEKLRRIFGVDKYELIKNNASNYARELRADLRNYNSLKEEQNVIKEKIKELKTELNLLYENKDSLTQKNKSLLEQENKIKENFEELEKETALFNELKSSNNVLVNDINSLNKNIKELEEEISKMNNNLKSKEKEAEKIPELKKSLDETKKELLELENKNEETNNKINEAKNKEAIFKNKISDIKKLLEDVDDLKICPTCKQEVSDSHKHSLKEQENSKLSNYAEKLKFLEGFFEKANTNKNKILGERKILEKELDEIRNTEIKQKLAKQALKHIEETKENISLLNKKKQSLMEELEKKQLALKNVKEKLESYKDLEQKIKNIKQEKEELNLKIRTEEKKLSANEQALKEKEKNLEEKQEEHLKKEERLNSLEEKRILENWLSNHFTNLMSVIEKHVLAKIHREFSSLFREWFSMLIEDAELEADIEQDFSPSINQNGYDSSIENLSGGEKTAVSLAYRLVLNKVINDLVHDVKTKGLMILDEPTDGFSSEQLDKVRDVLEKTNTKQIIIVSHEAKLESFVQNIIRINKNNHESQAVQM